MNNWLLAISAAGVAAMLILINYPALSDYSEYRINRAVYAPIAGAELVFEPRVTEPLASPPDIDSFLRKYPVGYTGVVHHPKDDSVTLTHPNYFGDGEYSQRYLPGQTFVYLCDDGGDTRTVVFLYQYRGTGLFQENRYMSLVHFELHVPPSVTCEFPDYLKYSVDIYDASGFEQKYGLEFYAPLEDPGSDYVAYVEPVRHAVTVTSIFIDPLPTYHLDTGTYNHWYQIKEVVHNSDDSITVTYLDRQDGDLVPGTEFSQTYAPGQTFLVSCQESEDHTYVHIFNYTGSEDLRGTESLIRVNFGAYTKAPIPCTYPDVFEKTVDAFDTSRFDRQYDMEWYRQPGF